MLRQQPTSTAAAHFNRCSHYSHCSHHLAILQTFATLQNNVDFDEFNGIRIAGFNAFDWLYFSTFKMAAN
jgi:hypothetical protein